MVKIGCIVKIAAVISALVFSVLVESQKIAGPFYCLNEGFFPRTVDSELIKYESDIKSTKNNYEDKRLYGKFYLKKTVKHLKAVATVWKESGNSWLRRGVPMVYENLCEMPFDMENFKKCFTGGVWEGDPCTLKAGEYNLKNWTFEHALKKNLGNKMFYGHYKFEFNVGGTTDDGNGEVDVELPLELRTWVKDETERKASAKSGGNKRKAKGA